MFAYDEDNRILLFQWNDNKVVNGCSSVADLSVGTVTRRVGSNHVELQCPNVLQRYQQNMFGVDKADHMRMHMGGLPPTDISRNGTKGLWIACFSTRT
jgi:Transposase IS4